MGFTHRQGASGATASGNSVAVTLASTPNVGNVVCFGMTWGGSAISALSVKDGNNNVYTISPKSPTSDSLTAMAYLIVVSNPHATITATWTGTAQAAAAWAEEFTVAGGIAVFDKDVSSVGAGPGTAINLPTITPSSNGALLW